MEIESQGFSLALCHVGREFYQFDSPMSLCLAILPYFFAIYLLTLAVVLKSAIYSKNFFFLSVKRHIWILIGPHFQTFGLNLGI